MLAVGALIGSAPLFTPKMTSTSEEDATNATANSLPSLLTVMTQNRSSCDVRSLRAMFENQETTSPDTRGRSPNGHTPAERPLSKVRSNFVSVEPTKSSVSASTSVSSSASNNADASTDGAMDIDIEKTKAQHGERISTTASFRREEFSFNEANNGGAINTLKKTVSGEGERRASNPNIYEIIPEAAIEATPAQTPAVEAKDYMAAGVHQAKDKDNNVGDKSVQDLGSNLKAMTLPGPDESDMPADNPDKPVTGAQEETGSMRPADPKDRAAMSPSPTPKSKGTPSARMNVQDLIAAHSSTPSSSTTPRASIATSSPATAPVSTPRTRRGSSVAPADSTPSALRSSILPPDALGSAPRARRGSVVTAEEASLLSDVTTRRASIISATEAPLSPSMSGSGTKPRRGSVVDATEASLPVDAHVRRLSITGESEKPVSSATAPRTPKSAAKRPPMPTIPSMASPSEKPSSHLSPKPAVRKPSKSSLTAPTASFQAKAKAQAAEAAASGQKAPQR